MARPKEFEPDVAVAAAMELFWRRGYANTSIQDLVDHLGLNRGSIYDTFGSKHELFLAALDQYCEMAPTALFLALEAEGPLLPRLRDVLVELADADLSDPDRKGCLLVNSAMENLPADSDTRLRFEQTAATLADAFESAVREAQRQDEVSASIDAAEAAVFLLTTLQGVRVMAKATTDRKAIVASIELALRALS